MSKEMLCPTCGERRMWQTTIQFNPYGVRSGWHCRVCEQKTRHGGGYRNSGDGMPDTLIEQSKHNQGV